MDAYSVTGRIGEGAHGVVVKARHNLTGRQVALKKVPLRRIDQGMPAVALREIKALQEVNCEHVIHSLQINPILTVVCQVLKLLDVFAEGTSFVLVFELMLGDLGEIIRDVTNPLKSAQIKCYMWMLLSGVAYLHDQHIMHRDLKPANLLISETRQLKVADFGLCRVFNNNDKRLYSHQVATRWYRAPELLYGARKYDEGVDLWAVGCIFGEMINRSPVFPGESDIDQLCVVLQILGTPTEDTWPGLTSLPDYKKITFPDSTAVPLETVLPEASPDAMDLIKKFLVYSSKQRISAKEALCEDYFFTHPLAADMKDMPLPNTEKPPLPATREYPTEFPLSEVTENVFDSIQKLMSFAEHQQ